MPTSALTRLFVALVTLSLIATACGSSEGSTAESTTSTGSTSSAAPGEIDPELVRQLGQSLTERIVTDDEVDCMIDQADGDDTLTGVFADAGQSGYSFSGETFSALGISVHNCIDASTLSATLLALSGEFDQAGQARFSECVTGALADDGEGDLAYVGMAALRVGFQVPAESTEATNTAMRSCVARSGLANQFAGVAEQEAGLTIEVDRACLEAELDDAFVDSFWGAIIDGEGETPDVTEVVDGCSSTFDSGLPGEVPADWVPWQGSGALAGVDPAARNAVFTEAPPMAIESSDELEAVLTTGDGEIRIRLFADVAPVTVNNFVSLAREGYYDGTRFHRVLPNFMAQGGDPTGSGAGGPGYQFADEASGLTDIDRRGLLAMANSGPDTNGSQFFITFDAAEHLNGNHVVFGEVIEGDDVLAAIDFRDPQAPLSRGEPLVSVEIIEA